MKWIIVVTLGFASCAPDYGPKREPVVESPFSRWKCYYDKPVNGNPDYLIIDFQNLQYGQRSMVSQTIYSNGVATESPLDVMITETGMEFYSNNATVKYLVKGPYMKLYLAEAGVNAADVTCVK